MFLSQVENVKPRTHNHPYDDDLQLNNGHHPQLSIVTNYKRQQHALLKGARLRREENFNSETVPGAGFPDLLATSVGHVGYTPGQIETKSIFCTDGIRNTNNSLSSQLDLMCVVCNNENDPDTSKIKIPRTCTCEVSSKKDRNFFDWVKQTHDYHVTNISDKESCGTFINPKEENHEHPSVRYMSDDEVTRSYAHSSTSGSVIGDIDNAIEEKEEDNLENTHESCPTSISCSKEDFRFNDDVDNTFCKEYETSPIREDENGNRLHDEDMEITYETTSTHWKEEEDVDFVITNVTCNSVTVTFVESPSKDGFFKEGFESATG